LKPGGTKRKSKDGFTLFELAAVFAIIAVLLPIAFLFYRAEQENVKSRVDEANVQFLRAAARRMLSNNKLTHEITWSASAGKDDPGSGWGAYLSAWPANPLQGGAATYVVRITPAGEVIISGNGSP